MRLVDVLNSILGFFKMYYCQIAIVAAVVFFVLYYFFPKTIVKVEKEGYCSTCPLSKGDRQSGLGFKL